MASKLGISDQKGSDAVFDVRCTICADDAINRKGIFNCQKCSKHFCNDCVIMHNKILKDHYVTDIVEGPSIEGQNVEDQNNSKAAKGIYSFEMCVEHGNDCKLEMFCEDDQKMLCNVCLRNEHRNCLSVVRISDKINYKWDVDLRKMNADIASIGDSLDKMQRGKEENVASVKASYERSLQEIFDIRARFNAVLDNLQKNTIKELESLKETLHETLQKDIDICKQTSKKIKTMSTIIEDIGYSISERGFIANIKFNEEKRLSMQILQEIKKNPRVKISLQYNGNLSNCMSTCTGLGTAIKTNDETAEDPNKAISITGEHAFKFNVKTDSDQYECAITSISETSDGQLIIADLNNGCIKLLSQACTVTSILTLPSLPWSMCTISRNMVAVAVSNRNSINQIQLVRVDNGTLINDTTLRLNHPCYGIAHHCDDLFVTSGIALYQYKMDGESVLKYESNIGNNVDVQSVVGVALSPDGKKIYVTDNRRGQLVTLNRDFNAECRLEQYTFQRQDATCNIHVAVTGHVFVFGVNSIIQVHTSGRNVLRTFGENGCIGLKSVYFSHQSNKLLVGLVDAVSIIQ